MVASLTSSGSLNLQNSKRGSACSADPEKAKGVGLGERGSAMAAHRAPGSRLAALGLAIMALALSCALAPAAFAAEVDVWGAQTHLSQNDASAEGDLVLVDFLNMMGEAGDTVFVSVQDGDAAIAEFYPHVIGQVENAEGSNVNSGSSADVFSASLPKDSLEEKLTSGAYKVSVYSKRTVDSQLFSGTLYGVWANLEGADPATVLIGARVAADGGAPSFAAPETLYVDGQAYQLVSGPEGEGALTYSYKVQEAADSVDGSVTYVDEEGNLLQTTTIPGLKASEERQVDIPSAIEVNGALYRTLSMVSSLTAVNPGQTSFVVQCAKISDEQSLEAGHYVATILMVDQDGNLIARDSVNVTGDFAYTAPSSIYKTHTTESGEQQVITYDIADPDAAVLHLSAANDKALVENGERTIEIKYTRAGGDALSVEVTYNLIDGQQRVGSESGKLGTKVVTVDEQNSKAAPDATITANGKEYSLAGDPASYEYTYGSGKTPVINVYYVPADYVAPGPYEVTINYVNFATGSVITSETATSSPDSLADLQIAPPAQFEEGGVTYVRLGGQDEPIMHSYFSNIKTYTVYYRDINDELSSAAVIEHVRVVYNDIPGSVITIVDESSSQASPSGSSDNESAGGEEAATEEGEGEQGTGDAAGEAADAGGTAGGAAGEGGQAAAGDANQAQLNQDGTYNVADGAGNGTLTNEAGVDSNTERIEDEEVALSSGVDENASQGTVFDTLIRVAMILGAIAVIAIIVFLAVFESRRRNGSR